MIDYTGLWHDEQLRVRQVADSESVTVAQIMADRMRKLNRMLLGLPVGASPESIQEQIDRYIAAVSVRRD